MTQNSSNGTKRVQLPSVPRSWLLFAPVLQRPMVKPAEKEKKKVNLLRSGQKGKEEHEKSPPQWVLDALLHWSCRSGTERWRFPPDASEGKLWAIGWQVVGSHLHPTLPPPLPLSCLLLCPLAVASVCSLVCFTPPFLSSSLSLTPLFAPSLFQRCLCLSLSFCFSSGFFSLLFSFLMYYNFFYSIVKWVLGPEGDNRQVTEPQKNKSGTFLTSAF